MGDYVLESNPALGRLIERLGAEAKRPGPEEKSSFHDSWRFQRRGRSKVPKRTRENPTAVGANRADVASVAEPTPIVEELVVEDDLWAILEDSQIDDEIVLIDFDEEPEVFAEELGNGEILVEDDEADEVLDVYGRADLDEFEEFAYEDAEAFDEMNILLEENQDDDAVSVQTDSTVANAEGDWIFDAFKAWMVKVDKAVA